MKYTKRSIFLFAFFLMSVSVQLFLYIGRGGFNTMFTPASEDSLYVTYPSVANISHLGDGKLIFTFSKAPAEQIALIDSDGQFKPIIGNTFKLDLPEGISEVRLKIDDKIDTLEFEYHSGAFYSKAGRIESGGGAVGLRYSTMYIGRPILKHLTEWNPHTYETSDSSVNLSKSQQQALWYETELRILGFLEEQRGVPSQTNDFRSLRDVVKAIENNTSQVWCAEISKYVTDKLSRRLTVRLVSVTGQLGFESVRTGGHGFLEVLDPISNRWTFSDPTNYVIATHWVSGEPVNSAQFQRLFGLRTDIAFRDLRFTTADLKSNSVLVKTWDQIAPQIRDDWRFHFSTRNKLFYFSGHAPVYDNSLINRVITWVTLDRQFMLAPARSLPVIAVFRILSFWIMVSCFAVLISFTSLWLLHIRRNGVAT